MLLSVPSFGQVDQWTWVSGSNVIRQTGVYGIKGVPDASNIPGARDEFISWIDSSDNLWLFGGVGYDGSGTLGQLNDLWKYDGTNWTWVSGSNTVDQWSVYGIKGTPATSNRPGGRHRSISWIDSNDNLWLFGGYGKDAVGSNNRFNDLWKFDGTNWTWISGSNVGGDGGIYGTKGVPDVSNVPGYRDKAISWIDSSDNLWLFGGRAGGSDNWNDLWRFDGSNWTWISGSNSNDGVGVYGTKGVSDPSNIPGGRIDAISWIDSSDNLWLFGGLDVASDDLNDLWKFDGTNWTWVSGSNTVNQSATYGTKGVADAANIPQSSFSHLSWIDTYDNLWLFGGNDFNGGFPNALNELWRFDGTNWAWVSGSSTPNESGVYGIKGIPATSNIPGARKEAVSWIDKLGNLWLFGGVLYLGQDRLNDLWKYEPVSTETDILSFSFLLEIGPATIDAVNHSVDIEVAFGTDVTSLIPTFSLSAGSSATISAIAQISGTTANDYTNSVVVTITAEDGITAQDWTVTVTYALNTATDILSFTISPQIGLTGIDINAHTIVLEIISGPSITNLTPHIGLSYGATVSPPSYAAQDFTNPVTYTVTAEDGLATQTWQVTVNVNAAIEVSTLDDIDGYNYTILKIGNQWWMGANLTTTSYADGTALVDGSAATDITGDYTSKYLFAVNDDVSKLNTDKYGYLYTWAAAMNGSETSKAQGVCPNSWHLPSDYEWQELEMYLGMSQLDVETTGYRGISEGGMLKEVGPGQGMWNAPNTGATNEKGFRAIPAGQRGSDGIFSSSGNEASFWTSDMVSATQAWGRDLNTTSALINRGAPEKDIGLSVRCIKDRSEETDILTFSFPEQTGTITPDAVNHTVNIEVAYGTPLTALVATFTLSTAASVKVGFTTQTSGTTPNDFTSPVTYTILAEDMFTAQDWVATVSVEEDLGPPSIENLTMPTVYVSGTASEILFATIADGFELSLVSLNYKLSNAADFTSKTLASATDVYSYTLTENQVTNVGLEYFFYAIDASGNSTSTDTIQIVIRYNAENGPTIPSLSAGGGATNWRMFSIPFVLDDKKVATQFEVPLGTYDDTKWRIVHYKNDTEGFVEYKNGLSVVERGKGYWFNSRQPATIPMSPGQSPGNTKDDLATLTLTAGWNQIGNPYTFDVSWADVISHNAITSEVESKLRVFDNGTSLTNSNVLKAFRGAYLKANEGITLEVPLLYNAGGRITGINDFEDGWLLDLTLESGMFSNNVSGLGMHPDASFSNDRYDQIRSPRFAKHLDVTFDHPEYFMSNFSRDIVPEQENFTWEFIISTNVDDDIRNINWNRPEFTGNQKLILIDLANGNVIDMLVNSHYSYSLSDTRKFKIVYGDEVYLLAQFDGNNVYLGDNYPNPFNKRTTIPYSVHGEESSYRVKINIYAMNGALVKTLVDDAMPSGIYTAQWDGKDNGGTALSGMFIYSLEVQTPKGVQFFRKKMIIQ